MSSCLWLGCGFIERVGGRRQVEFPLKGMSYRPLVGAILVYGKQSWVGEMGVAEFA